MRAGKNAVMELIHRKSPAVEWAACGRAPSDMQVSRDLVLWFNPTFISPLSASDIIVVARNLIS